MLRGCVALDEVQLGDEIEQLLRRRRRRQRVVEVKRRARFAEGFTRLGQNHLQAWAPFATCFGMGARRWCLLVCVAGGLCSCLAERGGASTTARASGSSAHDADADADAACPDQDHNICALGIAEDGVAAANDARAVTGAPLAMCSLSPLTGFARDGRCRTGVDDVGAHTVCGEVTAAFLALSKARGNDLVTPRGSFSGLVPGDRWCLCEARVAEALEAGVGVPVVLEATNVRALRTLPRETLEKLSISQVLPASAPAAVR